MRIAIVLTALLVSPSLLIFAQEQDQEPPKELSEVAEAFGPLPRQGHLPDVLLCAGANEVLWTTAISKNPHDRAAHEAKRKAGWYAGIALWVFEVDSIEVINAVKAATEHQPRSEILQLASQCRKAPDNWRE